MNKTVIDEAIEKYIESKIDERFRELDEKIDNIFDTISQELVIHELSLSKVSDIVKSLQ
ncbi:MAG: hypothetical protein ACLUFU_03080 [Bacilli bacterium]